MQTLIIFSVWNFTEYKTDTMLKKTKTELCKQFFTETTIHGCRYTVDRQFYLCENIIWAIITVIFFVIGACLIYVRLLYLVKLFIS